MSKLPIADERKSRYEALVLKSFGFLRDVREMKCRGVRRTGGDDPRDRELIVRYERGDMRVDIAWNEFDNSVGVVVRFLRDDLDRDENYVYLEPFIEMLTNGGTKPLIPSVRQGMSVTELQSVVERRSKVFKDGLDRVLGGIASRLETFFPMIETVSSETLRKYHVWMKSRT